MFDEVSDVSVTGGSLAGPMVERSTFSRRLSIAVATKSQRGGRRRLASFILPAVGASALALVGASLLPAAFIPPAPSQREDSDGSVADTDRDLQRRRSSFLFLSSAASAAGAASSVHADQKVESKELDKVLVYNDENMLFADYRTLDAATLNRTMTDEEYFTACLDLTPYQRLLAVEAKMEKPASKQAGQMAFANGVAWNNEDPGVYTSIISGSLLFSSSAKFQSGFGWPSFSKPIDPDRIFERYDLRDAEVPKEKRRIQVLDRASMTHLGYVYPGGPSGKQYILNAATMKFLPGDPKGWDPKA
eukprot:TRINITY_DN23114_c0_g1_i1.p1 TRINITY_DN23114_c0_g1~~TRINITY_DN23114_c0_g1_i1.p1  ORF type:complete len:304 (-),score=65.08 TRINITY_DN23114_c0_g1_i1:165-1076(-)